MPGSIKLPQHLLERARVHLPGTAGSSAFSNEGLAASTFPAGCFVVYWTRSALRVDENPALDVARCISRQLNLPLLVYQGLSQRYPFASDRHHTFILQAARQLQSDLQAANIAFAFHLETPATRRKTLVDLVNQAACIVTEEMPVDPPRHFLKKLQQQSQTIVLTVDTACILPMQSLGRATTRAFQFRQSTALEYQRRISRAWPECQEYATAFDTAELPFSTLDWSRYDISDWVAQCDIDHSVGPVVDTVGGSLAGYSRWQSFRSSGLRSYHNLRNSSELDGVSRMSAYLHYGMVSPFRIAREADAEGSEGAEKFLDELLIWRELAYSFCFYRPDHDGWSALPTWAQQTLLQHQSDARPAIYDWETLARGQTEDSLWNAAQQSLLRHGELHNNLRMTWGKMLITWVRDPRDALAMMIDLNHRYALDGRDPCSYAGILWCFGQFDREFRPEQKIFGLVRPRTTTEHAKRIRIEAYRANRLALRCSRPPKVAVIGAGISGLTAARTLQDHGLEVVLFEKSRGVGGRVSTRRSEASQFDHGAQYFTARHPVFQRYVNAWCEQGWVKPWGTYDHSPGLAPVRSSTVDSQDSTIQIVSSEGSLSRDYGLSTSYSVSSLMNSIVVLKPGQQPLPAASHLRYVACPGMSELGKRLAKNLDVRFSSKVDKVGRVGEQFEFVDDASGNLGLYDRVICTAPPAQASILLADFTELSSRITNVELLPCWALMVTFEHTLDIDWAGAFVQESPIAWIARESSKPDRAPKPSFVIHANPTWSQEHLELQPEQIAELLLSHFFQCIGRSAVVPVYCTAHRWRYSIAEHPLKDGCLYDSTHTIYACGDWVMGSRIEGAFLSGLSAAGRILGDLQPEALAPKSTQLTLFGEV